MFDFCFFNFFCYLVTALILLQIINKFLYKILFMNTTQVNDILITRQGIASNKISSAIYLLTFTSQQSSRQPKCSV